MIGSGRTVPLEGAVVGLHYSAQGDLSLVGGNQFKDVTVTNRVAFSAIDAVDRALIAASSQRGFPSELVSAVHPTVRLDRARTAQLFLRTADGINFRYVYSVRVRDQEGQYFRVEFDAETEEVLRIFDPNPSANCNPDDPWTSVIAVGVPIRPELAGVTRNLRANVASRSGFTHEGFWQADSLYPNMSVLEETSTAAYRCDPDRSPAYSLIPLRVENSQPSYKNFGDEWRGDIAGDALHHTGQTMLALRSMGQNSWNGIGGDANIVVESTLAGVNNARFYRDVDPLDARVPPGSSVAIGPASGSYSFAAALDIVAHEWGHGVINKTAEFPLSGEQHQLHEGWADVIGHMTEKLKQNSGDGIEQSNDWRIGEDTATIFAPYSAISHYRSGTDDDGTSGHTFNGSAVNNRMHKDDVQTGQTVHDIGNMMSVVYHLLANGGQNPICSRSPGLSGCGTSVNALGFTKASNILFATLVHWLPPLSQWHLLADYASDAAFDLYSNCEAPTPHSAVVEQGAVDKAFGAIGYPRTEPMTLCN